MARDEARKAIEDYECMKHRVKMLEDEISTLRTRCYPGAEQAFDNKMYGCLMIVPVNYKAKKE
jgi:hypothetical protein